MRPRVLLAASAFFVAGITLGFFLKSRGESSLYKILGNISLGLLFVTNLQAQIPAWIEFSPVVSSNVNLLREQFNDREFPLCLEGRWVVFQ